MDKGKARILCAIDTADLDAASALAGLLAGEIGGVKLGKEFFTAHGPHGVRRVAAAGLEVFLDLKFHDIPNTVAGGVRAAAGLGCRFLTVHASGGAAMLRAAVDAARDHGAGRPLILAVTVLTSLDENDLAAVGQRGPIADQAVRLAALAAACGVDGLVCAPPEIGRLRARIGSDRKIVAAGIRPGWAETDDQKRPAAPAAARAAGADYLVVGRPITRAADPVAAARRIAGEIGPG